MNLVLPPEFLNEIEQILGPETGLFCDALDREECAAFRVNTLKPASEKAAAQFMAGNVPWEKTGYYALEGSRPGAGLAHAGGALYMQDASAMAPVAVLNPVPGEVILDMCAAPGGKSSQIAAYLKGEGVLVSNEIVKNRAQILKSNLERLGVANACVTNASPDRFTEPVFDAVLTDAPCSGEGMFRRGEGALEEWTPDSPAKCAERQQKILDSAAGALKPGGRLVYSTCTFNRQENEFGIARFLERHPEFEPWDFELDGIGKSENGCLRLWPHRLKGEGHFVCRLIKKGAPCGRETKAYKETKEASAALALLKKTIPCELPRGHAEIINGELWLVPDDLPELKGIYTLSKGLALGKAGKGFFEPAHQLAMALSAETCSRCVSLDSADASMYMQGEAIALSAPDGWTLVTWNGLPLGWGKCSQGTLKNHLPKGLRLRGGHALKG